LVSYFFVFLHQIRYIIAIIMGKQQNKAGNHTGVQAITLCISTMLVLILLGIVVLSVLTAHNLSSYVKENLTVTLLLGDDMSQQEAHQLCSQLYHRRYIKSINYISKEEALREQSTAMGSNPKEFLGDNPFVASMELNMKSDYANKDSLKWISAELKHVPKVTDVTYQEDLMESVNSNLKKVSLVLLVLAVLLTFVSFSLINNTVRLNVYSRRFLIHTMKLVGASWGFIRKPFIIDAVWTGVIAAFLADALLASGMFFLNTYEPDVMTVITWDVLTITGCSVFIFGIVITVFCSYLSVNKFLRMKAGALYKI
jgi:cell division transport system permease protein